MDKADLEAARKDPQQGSLFEELHPSAAELTSLRVECLGWEPDPPTPPWKSESGRDSQ